MLPAPPPSLTLTLSADNVSAVYVNGAPVGGTDSWQLAGVFTLPLQPGPNVVAVKVTDLGGAAGLLGELNWDGQGAVTDSAWRVSATAPPGWEGLGFDDSAWVNATSYGTYGVAPWYQRVVGFPSASLAQWIWTSDNQNVDQAYFRFTLQVGDAPLAVDTTSLPDATVDQPYSGQLLASGGAAPYTWALVGGSLPAWASLTADGVLSGIPDSAGTSTFTVQVQDAAGATASQQLSLTVLPAPPTLNISSCTPPCISSLTVADITTTSVAISWATNPECSGTIFWGTTSELGKIVVANNLATTDHWARVYGLTTRTHYFFKVSSVCGGTTVTSDLRSFNTK